MKRLCLCLAFAAGPLLAQERAGGEFPIGTSLVTVATAATPDGFVVVWTDNDGSGSGLSGRRFDAVGVPVGADFRVNSYTTGLQGHVNPPGLAVNRSGGFVVAWPADLTQTNHVRATARRFDRRGQGLGIEFAVDVTTTGFNTPYAVAVAADGHFVVAWNGPITPTNYGVFTRRYDAEGTPLGPPVLAGGGSRPHLAAAPDGSFVVVWSSQNGVFARRFDAGDNPLGPELTVTPSSTFDADVAMGPDRSFVVAWGGALDAQLRRYASDGTPLGGAVTLTAPGDTGGFPDVAFDRAGRFVAAWHERSLLDSNWDVMAQRFDRSGAPREPAFLVNTATTGTQASAELVIDPVGNFIVTWSGEFSGRVGQRFGGLRPGGLGIDDSGNGVLEVGDTFTLATRWRNVSGAALTFQGRSSAPSAPGALGLTLTADANYGTVAAGASGTCGGPCFSGTLAGARPAGHVDADFREDILPAVQGQSQTWPLHVGDSFTDVPRSSPYYRFIEILLHVGVSGGCGGSSYCSAATTTRAQMAVFVLASSEGTGYLPPPCATPVFADVPASSPFCRWVEELARRGIANGCGGGNFCPDDPVSREQMAVFLLRALDPAPDPPACTTPVFNDVPASSPYCRWIEELVRRGVTAGCGGGRYCPADPVTREQMAVFLTTTFGLTLYGP